MAEKIEFEVEQDKLLMGYTGWFCGFKNGDIKGYFTFPNKQNGLSMLVNYKNYKVTIEPVKQDKSDVAKAL